MDISFVIPAFNEEKNIAACVASISTEMKGRGKLYEIIVVNNASTDGTRERALEQGAVVVDEPRKGIVWARKAGFEKSVGGLVANIDADNILPCGWFDTVDGFFSNDAELLALSGPLIYHDVSCFKRYLWKFFYCFAYSFDTIAGIFGKNSLFQGGNYVVRREAVVRIGGYDTSIEFYGEDVDVGKRLSHIGKIIWTFKLPMFSSGRRIQKEGTVVMAYKYAKNYLSAAVLKRPYMEDYIDVR